MIFFCFYSHFHSNSVADLIEICIPKGKRRLVCVRILVWVGVGSEQYSNGRGFVVVKELLYALNQRTNVICVEVLQASQHKLQVPMYMLSATYLCLLCRESMCMMYLAILFLSFCKWRRGRRMLLARLSLQNW